MSTNNKVNVTFEAMMSQFNSEVKRGVNKATSDIKQMGTNLSNLGETGKPTSFMDKFKSSVKNGSAQAANDLANIGNMIPGGMGGVGGSLAKTFMTSFQAGILAGLVIVGAKIGTAFAKFSFENLFKKPSETAIDFEKKMDSVATKVGATTDELQRLSDKSREIGANTQFTLIDSAESMEKLALSGLKSNQIIDAMSPTMDLAAASGEGLAVATESVANNMRAFGIATSETARFVDVMATVATNSNTTIAEMSESFTYSASMARTLGFELEDVALQTGLMANAGVKSSMAGTTLRAVMIRMSKDSGAAADAMKELGVSTMDSAGNMKPLNDIIAELRVTMKDLDETKQINIATDIAGVHAASGFLNMINATEHDINKLSDAIANSSGKASEMAIRMNDNVAGSLVKVQSKMESFREVLGNKLLPIISEVLGYLLNMMDRLEASGAIDKLAESVANVGAMIGDVFMSLINQLPTLITLVTNLFNYIATGIAINIPQIENFIFVLRIIIDVLNGIIATLNFLGIIFAIVISGMSAVFWGLISEMLYGISLVTEYLSNLLEKIPLIGNAFNVLNNVIQGWSNAASNNVNRVTNRVNNLINRLRTAQVNTNALANMKDQADNGEIPPLPPQFDISDIPTFTPSPVSIGGGGGGGAGGGAGRSVSAAPTKTPLEKIEEAYKNQISVIESRSAIATKTKDSIALETINKSLHDVLGNKLDEVNELLYKATDPEQKNILEIAANQISLKMLDVMDSINKGIGQLIGSFNKPSGLIPLTEYAYDINNNNSVLSNRIFNSNNIEMNLTIKDMGNQGVNHIKNSVKDMLNTLSNEMLGDVTLGTTGVDIY